MDEQREKFTNRRERKIKVCVLACFQGRSVVLLTCHLICAWTADPTTFPIVSAIHVDKQLPGPPGLPRVWAAAASCICTSLGSSPQWHPHRVKPRSDHRMRRGSLGVRAGPTPL